MTHDYPYLPEGRSFKYAPLTNPFIIEAKRIRDEWSTDGLNPTGAVIVMNGKIIARAANQSAIKNWRLRDFHRDVFCVRRALNVPTGTKYWMCPGCASHRHHAESRAIKEALKKHGSIEGADLYLYGHWWCCEPCWDSMIKAGIKNVYLAEGATELFKRTARGKFIVIEGGEGSGKSSLLAALKEELGDKIITTREPGGSPYAEHIRTAALKNPLAKTAPAETTLCLMFAARFDNAVNLIEPALRAGKPVIADRFDGSSYAYQVGGQSGGKFEQIFWNLRKHLSTVPDVYIFIDVDPKEGIRRANARNQSLGLGTSYDHFDDRELEFHEKVRNSYLKFFKQVPHIRIDANRPLEHVKKDFVNTIRELIL